MKKSDIQNLLIEKIVDDVIEFEKCRDTDGFCRKMSRKKHEGRDDTPFEPGGLLASGEHDSDPSVSERRKRCTEGDEEARCNCRRGTENAPECKKGPRIEIKADELPLDVGKSDTLESVSEMETKFLDISGKDPLKVSELMKRPEGKRLYAQIEDQRTRDRKSDPAGYKNIRRLV